MSVWVYGSGDDLVKVEGAVNEEFLIPLDTHMALAWLAFSDGTILRVELDDDGLGEYGVWRIHPVHHGECQVRIESAVAGSDSDRAELISSSFGSPPIQWVVHGVAYAKAETKEEIT